jgi:hypothetical protein
MARGYPLPRNSAGHVMADALPNHARGKFGYLTLITFHLRSKTKFTAVGFSKSTPRQDKVRETIRRKRKLKPRPVTLNIFRPFVAKATKAMPRARRR